MGNPPSLWTPSDPRHADGQVLTFGLEPVYVRAAELPPQLANDSKLRIETAPEQLPHPPRPPELLRRLSRCGTATSSSVTSATVRTANLPPQIGSAGSAKLLHPFELDPPRWSATFPPPC
jgi:hypothetical protein